MANYKSGAERRNDRMDKIFEDARRLERERLERGEIPNPSLTSPETALKYGWEMIGREVRRAPLFTSFLNACKVTGDMTQASAYIEELLTTDQLRELTLFIAWLNRHRLTVGFGTINLRWCEFQSNREPISPEAAYQLAMKGVK